MNICNVANTNNLKDGLAVSALVSPIDYEELWEPLFASAENTGVHIVPVPMQLNLLPAKAIERMLRKRRKPLSFSHNLFNTILKEACDTSLYFCNDDEIEIGFDQTKISPAGTVYMAPENQDEIRNLRYKVLLAFYEYLIGRYSIPEPKLPDPNSNNSVRNGEKGFYLPIGRVDADIKSPSTREMLNLFRKEIPHPGTGDVFDVGFDTLQFSQ